MKHNLLGKEGRTIGLQFPAHQFHADAACDQIGLFVRRERVARVVLAPRHKDLSAVHQRLQFLQKPGRIAFQAEQRQSREIDMSRHLWIGFEGAQACGVDAWKLLADLLLSVAVIAPVAVQQK